MTSETGVEVEVSGSVKVEVQNSVVVLDDDKTILVGPLTPHHRVTTKLQVKGL